MEVIELPSDCHHGFALDHASHSVDISSSTSSSDLIDSMHCSSVMAATSTVLGAKLLLDQGQSGFESHPPQSASQSRQQRTQGDDDAYTASQEAQPGSGSNENHSHQPHCRLQDTAMVMEVEMHKNQRCGGSGHAGLADSETEMGQGPCQSPAVAASVTPPPIYSIPLPATSAADTQNTQSNSNNNNNTTPSSSPSIFHQSSSKYPTRQHQEKQHPFHSNPLSLCQSPSSMATIAPTPTTKSTLPSPLPTGLRTHIGSDRALLSPSHGSDISEVPLDAFAEGEVLETEISDHDRDHHQHWGNRNSSSSTASTSSTSPYSLNSSSAQLRIVGARCSSSTLFDESRPSSSDQTSWSKPDSGIEIQKASPALFRPPSTPTFQLRPSEQKHAFEDASTPKNQQQHQPIVANVLSVDQKQRPQQCQNKINMNDSVLQSNGQAHSTTDDSSSTHSATPAVASSASPFKIEPSPSVRLSPSSHGAERQHSKGSGSPLHVPTTPMAPTSAEMDKPTKNLMIFNQIPRQWPSSQETLHYNYVTKNTSKKMPMVIKDFDPATAERIDRVINKERPLSRAAKERLAAEQKEAEAEARGFFDPARRWKGRDVYPRPANWVYCRRTKNNWLEKTKILADQYKLFKGQVLGKGHHADVYKGIDLITGQDLAIKVIYKTVTRRLGFVNEDPMQEVKNRRLLNEAWFIDYLKDAPGVCKMLRVIETATKFYFVMELAQSDLNSYSNGINMREEEIRHILKPIFECLKHAHSRDITHRDIKPENILLRIKKDWLPTNGTIKIDAPSHHATKGGGKKHERQQQKQQHQLHHIEDSTTATNNSSTLSNMLVHESSFMDADSTMDNGDDRSSMDSSTLYNYDHRFDAFLADWGLAVEHDCNSGRKPVGTPLYAAPEVVRKMKRIRRREWINYRACDIWSLGVTMFVVASGIYPYHTHDALEAQSPPNWAALESSGMSQEYIAFTQRLMNLTAEQRPSAAEACNDPWLQG